jgi:hypothetical protein
LVDFELGRASNTDDDLVVDHSDRELGHGNVITRETRPAPEVEQTVMPRTDNDVILAGQRVIVLE